MSKKEKKAVSLSIKNAILNNSKVIVRMIAGLVIFVICCLFLLGSVALTAKTNFKNAVETESVNCSQNAWTVNVIKAVSEGVRPKVVLEETECDMGLWLGKQKTESFKDAEVKAAYESLTTLHTEIHSIAKDYNENGTTNMYGTIRELIAMQQELNGYMNTISTYFTEKGDSVYSSFVYMINITIVVNVILSFVAPKIAKKRSNKLADEISAPVKMVAKWAEELAQGADSIDYDNTAVYLDEITQMLNSFSLMANSIQEKVRVVQRVAEGDMTAFVNIRSTEDVLAQSLYKMVQTNDLMFNEITKIADGVASGSCDIANASNSLAASCTTQVHSITDFQMAIEEMSKILEANIEKVNESKGLSDDIKDEIADNKKKMQELIAAMQDIKEASEKISAIIKTLENIATQTNMLALNASIEAARAGESGKGFAVVAGEVGNLAAQSAEAVVESKKLIEDTLAKVEAGNMITEATSEAFNTIVQSADLIHKCNDEMQDMSKKQESQLEIIKTDIQEISDAVTSSAAISEETASSCDMLNASADNLKEAMGKFNLRKREPGKAYIPPEKEDDEEFKKMAQYNYEQSQKKES